MPYVVDADRPDLKPHTQRPAVVEGELNYQITCLIVDYLEANGLSYARIGDVRGALLNASDEFYARVARPYEDTAIERNGDVYPAWMLGK